MRAILTFRKGTPDKDGEYIIVERWGIDGYPYKFNILTYTVEGGWCTYRDYEGILHIPENHNPHLWDDIIAWMPVLQYRFDANVDMEDTLVMLEDESMMLLRSLDEEDPVAKSVDLAHAYLEDAYKVYRRGE